ncbi:MAG TPA: ACT domain-containing protein [Methanocorpusculum sp.]|nr:ACT domain-containing protein [Methanocorpusculum sp.]
MKLELQKLNRDFSVCKVVDYSQAPLDSAYCFIGKTDEENSLVCIADEVPKNTLSRDDGWKGLRIRGVLDFSLIGILARVSSVLADAGISIFAVSTYNTDYILIKEARYQQALAVLEESGYTIVD